MSTSSPVLVLGGTGMIGSALVHQLHAQGVPVVATVRDTAKAKAKLPSEVKLLQVDLKDPKALQQAAKDSGAKRAFGLMDIAGNESLEALKVGGVDHLVFVSTSFIGLPTEPPTALQMWQTGFESAIRAAGFTYTFLRCEAFLSNMFRWKDQINSTGSVKLSYPDVPERFVAFDDIAAVGATALTTSQYDNKAVTVQGATAVTERQQLQLIAQQIGKPIEVVQVSEEELKKAMAGHMPPPVADSVHAVRKFRQERGADWQAQTDAVVTGSVSVEQFVARNKDEFTA